MTDSLLDGPANHAPIIDQNVDYLAELTGPGKKFDRSKYKDELEMFKAIAKGKYESDVYIPFLEQGRDELRQDYLKVRDENVSRAKLEELIEKLSNRETPLSELPNANEGAKMPVYNPDEVKSLVSDTYQQMKRTEKETENFNIAKDKLIESYGTNYQNIFKQHVEQLGLTVEDMTALAKKSPSAFFKTMGLDRPANQDNSWQAPPNSSSRSDGFAPQGAQKRTWKYYQDLKASKPSLYWDQKTQTQMHKDAIALGDAFADGDF